jgi:hypothetical protein
MSLKFAIGFFLLGAIFGFFIAILAADWIAQKVMHYREGKAMKKRDLIRDRDINRFNIGAFKAVSKDWRLM